VDDWDTPMRSEYILPGLAPPADAITEKFQRATAALLEEFKRDENIIAVILEGSLAYDKVWEFSDVDLMLVIKDQKLTTKGWNLCVDDVIFSVSIIERSKFREGAEASTRGGIMHSVLSRSKLLFTRDEGLRNIYEDMAVVGDRDRDLQLMSYLGYALGALHKAEKFLFYKKQPAYAALWLLGSGGGWNAFHLLAQIEVFMHNDIPMRESLQQALAYNPAFFEEWYLCFADRPKTMENVSAALDAAKTYLREHADACLAPVIAFMKENPGPQGVSDFCRYFEKKISVDPHTFFDMMEWMVAEGSAFKDILPIHVTPKSRFTVDEAAYILSDDGI